MKITLIICLLLCCMFISPSQTTQSKKTVDTSVRNASTKYFEWRKRMLDDTAAAIRRRWCNQLQEVREETDSMVAAYRWRRWQARHLQNK